MSEIIIFHKIMKINMNMVKGKAGGKMESLGKYPITWETRKNF